MMTWAALAISAWSSTLRRVASPLMPISPAALASATAAAVASTTTIDPAGTPHSPSVLITLRPLVPYPTMTV